MAEAPFTIQTRLTAISLAVKVMGLIADVVCPRVNVGGPKFTYTVLDTAEGFTIPDVKIGRTSRANQVEFGAEDKTESVVDYGLEDPVPVRDMNVARDQRANIDPLAVATERTTQLVELAREKRVADLITTLDHYDAALRTTLAGDSQWSSAESDPLNAILAAKDKMLVPASTLVTGQAVWTKLRQHPKIVEAVNMSGAGAQAAGAVAAAAVADLLELDTLHVGRAWVNTARPGQDAVYARLWGKDAALLHINRQIVSPMDAVPTFAFTAEWLGRQAGTYIDSSRGRDGAEIVKVVESCKELISFRPCGYLFKNAVA